MEKKKYSVTIAGVDMNIISDEREDIVMRLISQLDSEISAITGQSRNYSKIDAAILVALDHASNRLKAEKRVRNLEAQIALYDANLRRMREENIRLKTSMLGKVSETAEEIISEEQIPLETEEEEAPAEAHDIAELFEEPAPAEDTDDADDAEVLADDTAGAPAAKFDKLRQIESLLRGN